MHSEKSTHVLTVTFCTRSNDFIRRVIERVTSLSAIICSLLHGTPTTPLFTVDKLMSGSFLDGKAFIRSHKTELYSR